MIYFFSWKIHGMIILYISICLILKGLGTDEGLVRGLVILD